MAAAADSDAADISSDYRPRPNTGLFPDNHIPHDISGFIDVSRLGYTRRFTVKSINH
jgi:hypothetical protein